MKLTYPEPLGFYDPALWSRYQLACQVLGRRIPARPEAIEDAPRLRHLLRGVRLAEAIATTCNVPQVAEEALVERLRLLKLAGEEAEHVLASIEGLARPYVEETRMDVFLASAGRP